MGIRFLKLAVVYLFIGASLGLIMGITQKFTLAPVHAHLVLLGWASLALAGLIYHHYPAAASTRLARYHFWLHNLGLPVFMIALGLVLSGVEAAGPLLGIAATTVLVGLALFTTNVLVNVKAQS
ncbi:MAG: cytochrome-c oxidase [Betaproteobacteria bacterium]